MKSTDLPPLNLLKTFESAGRHLSFTKAAQELHMTQSAVSQQIRQLENRLGHLLFGRTNRRISLTNSGNAYLAVVQQSLNYLDQGTQDIFSPLNQGVLTLQVNTAFLMLWLIPRLARFTNAYPELELRILNANWTNEFSPLSSDIIVSHGNGQWPEMISERLVHPTLRPYSSVAMARNIQSPGDLACFPMLEVMGTDVNWKDWFSHVGYGHVTNYNRHQVDTAAVAANLATQNCGVSLIYDELVELLCLENKLVCAIEHGIPTNQSFYLLHYSNSPMTKPAQLFRDWILDETAATLHRTSDQQ